MTARAVAALLLCAAAAGAGELTRRSDRSLERVQQGGPPRYDLDFLLADLIPQPGRRFTEFSGDLSGRYLDALAAAGAPESLRLLVPRVLALQRPDGGFANPLSGGGVVDDDMARVWGHGRLLVGLLAAAESTGDERALAAARRLGDFLTDVAPRFNDDRVEAEFGQGKLAHGYICWTQNLEGLARLYGATGEARYLEAARAMAQRVERRPGQHSHGYLTSVRGLLALAQASGEEAYRTKAEEAWDALAASENVLPTGTIPEYFAPGIGRDEGCSDADWVRLSLSLYRRTGRERYLEAAETAVFNAFFLNQFSSGDFGHVELAHDGLGYGVARAWWCCTLHGLRAFSAIREGAFQSDGAALRYVLPVDGEGSAEGLTLRADAELAQQATVRFEVVAAPEGRARLEIRQPAWSGPLETDFPTEPRDGAVAFDRVWRVGEAFTIRYAPLERREGGMLFLGPWLLAASEAAAPAFFDEPHEGNRLLWETLAPADRPSRRRVDYIPAGYPEQVQSLTLRPLAERFEGPDGLRWQWKFREQESRAERTAKRLVEQSRGRLLPFGVGLAAGALLMGLLWPRRQR
ncbi:MAG: hypothetical protein GC160_18085 [Acidobacteria bacterium]|nr:hypothetical protein [Acidobacteriota bacterium]